MASPSWQSWGPVPRPMPRGVLEGRARCARLWGWGLWDRGVPPSAGSSRVEGLMEQLKHRCRSQPSARLSWAN